MSCLQVFRSPAVPVLLVLSWLAFSCDQSRAPAIGSNPSRNTGDISGGAWITRGSGESGVLRGFEIVLCRPAVVPDLTQVKNQKWKEAEASFQRLSGYPGNYLGGYATLIQILYEMDQTAAKHALGTTKTDVEGKYVIQNVPAGDYYLYAEYQSSFSVGYWLVPVHVQSDQSARVDFDNSNMAELYNKH